MPPRVILTAARQFFPVVWKYRSMPWLHARGPAPRLLTRLSLLFRTRAIVRRCPLGPKQRGPLRERLGRLDPLKVRVTAVNEPGSIRYARELRDVMHEAAWPATGVFKSNDDEACAGVVLAVRNIVAPPGEAFILLDALRRLGPQVVWAHKPTLSHDRTIEIQVGRLG